MINKKGIWFLTLFSLILVLSVYYITMPSELLLMNSIKQNEDKNSVEKTDDVMQLKFNSYIFSDEVNEQILEEVIYTICLSIKDNYNVEEVVIEVENKEITKKMLKTIE